MSLTVRNHILIFRKIDNYIQRGIDAAGITNSRYIAAIGDLIGSMRSFNSIQSDFIDFQSPSSSSVMALWLGLGFSDTQKCLNFMNPVDSDAAFRLSIVGGATILPYGYYRDGTQGKYFNTHVKPYTHFPASDCQLSVYPIQNATRLIYNTNYGDIGCNSASKYCYIDMRATASTNGYIGDGVSGVGANSDYGDGSNIHAIDGLYTMQRNGNVLKFFKKGTQTGTLTRASTFDSGIDIEMFLTATNNNGTPSAGEKAIIRLAFLGPKAISDSIHPLLSTAGNKFSDSINPVVIFNGDSTTEGVGASDPEHRWTSWLSQQLDSFLEINQGLAGTRLQTMLDNSDPSHAVYNNRELLIPNKTRLYQYLVFSNLGWNDLAQGLTDAARFKSQYISIIENQVAKGYPRNDIYVGNMMRGYQDWIPTDRITWDNFQEIIRQVALETGTNHVNTYAHMAANDVNNTWNQSAGNKVHLTDLGNAEIASFWKTQIKLHAVT